MELTEEDIRQFMEIWSEEFKEDLAPAEARERASALLTLYMLMAFPCSDQNP